MNTTRKDRFIQKATRLAVKVLLFTLFLSVFLYACIGAHSSVAQAANSWYDDYIESGLSWNGGEVSTNIEYVHDTHGGYMYKQLVASGTWEGSNTDYYHGWYITFDGRAYYSVINGAIGDIQNKISVTGSGTADGKRISLYGKKPNSDGDLSTGNYWGQTYSKKGGTSYSHDFSATATITGAQLVSYGVNDTANKRITYYTEWGLYGGKKYYSGLSAGDVDTYLNSNGIWLDIYISDATAPYNNSSSGTSIKVKDDSAGIYSVQLSGPENRTFYSSGSNATSGFSNNTKDFSYTAVKSGAYTVTVTDNVGNSTSFNYTVPKYNLTLNANYPSGTVHADLTTKTYSEHVTVAGSATNIPSEINDLFWVEGYGISGWTSSNGTVTSNTYTPASLANVTLTAQWIQLFTLIYHNNNGGTASTVPRNANHNTTANMDVLSPPGATADGNGIKRPDAPWSEFYKPGYYLAGWATTANATTPDVGSTIATGENGTAKNIYAVWKPVTYYVEYIDGSTRYNGAKVTGEGTSVPILNYRTDCGFSNDSAFFMYWRFPQGGNSAVYSGNSVTFESLITYLGQRQDNVLDSEVSLELYAQWTGALEFGVDNTKDAYPWGSKDNPYIIRNSTHLSNLSKLVNGQWTAYGTDGRGSLPGSEFAAYTNTQAIDATYARCYFKLADNVDRSGTLYDNSFSSISYTVDSNHSGWGNDGEKLTNIADKNPSTKFCDSNMAAFTFSYDMSSARYVDSFSFTNASDAESHSHRIPQEFIIQASLDGSSYTTVCSIKDTNKTWSTNSGTYTISFSKPGTYRYFKIYVKSRRGFELNSASDGQDVKEDGKNPLQFADLYFNGPTKAGATLTPIGKDASHPFNGHFHGNDHTVTVAISVDGNYAGLFGYMRAGSISNLTVAGEIFATGNYAGALVGHTHTDRGKYDDIIIKDVTNSATVLGYGSYTGGLIGCAQDTSFRGDVINNGAVTGNTSVGGITGFNYGSSTNGATIVNNGAVLGTTNVGGYAGELNWGYASGTHTNNGTVKATSDYAGGILGRVTGDVTISNSFTNNGVVMASSYVGGIAGCINSGNTISNNSIYVNAGHVHGKNYVGGIFGYLHTNEKDFSIRVNTDASKVPSNANHEMVSPTGLYAGGFAGWVQGNGTIKFLKGSKITGEIDSAESSIVDFGNSTGNVIGSIAGVNLSATFDFSALTDVVASGTINGNRKGAENITINGVTYNSAAIIGGLFGYNGGNIVGRSDKGTLRGDGNIFAVNGGAYVGGIAAINAGGTLTNMVVYAPSGFTNTGFAKKHVGGLVGLMSGGTLSGVATFTGNMVGTNYVGGLVGEYTSTTALTLSNLTHSGTITASGNFVGGFFGNVNTSAKVTLTNLTNTGNISGVDHVGGIAGQIKANLVSNGLVNGTTLSGTISGGNYVGGIFGEIGVTFTGSLNNAINRMTISASADYVGGLVGIHHRGTVENCANLGAVTGRNNVGGVIGRSATNAGSQAITVRYCLNDGTVKATNGTSGGVIGLYQAGSATLTANYLYNFGSVSGATFGGIIGNNATAYISLTKSWAFYESLPSSTNNVGKYTYTGHYVANMVDATVLPLVGSTLYTDWTAILTTDFNGFYFKAGIVADAGEYLSLEYLTTTNAVTAYAQPSNTLTSTHDTNSGTCTFGNIEYAYASAGADSFNVRARFLAVGSGSHNLVYDGTDKSLCLQAKTEAFADDLKRVTGYTSKYHFTLVLAKSADTVNVGTFTYDAHMVIGDVVMGCARGQSATIKPFDVNGSEAHILYDGNVYGGLNTYSIDGKTLTDVTSFKSNLGVIDYNASGHNFYIYRFREDGAKILVYTVPHTYGSTSLTGTHNAGEGVTVDLKGTVTTDHSAVSLADGYLVDRMQEASTTFRTSTNYKGTLTLSYYTIDSDFGVIALSDRDGNGTTEAEWGSVDNPYVISHWIHLLRLSEIVNGFSSPINSVKGIGAGDSTGARSDNSYYSAYVGADGTIKRSYFLVTASIEMPSYVKFLPIGGWRRADYNNDSVFEYYNDSDAYFGGVFDGEYHAGAYPTIDLGSNLSINSYTIPEIYRELGTVKNGFDDETLMKLFDGKTETKYYSGTSGSLTFVIDLNSSIYVDGFYWATANDTNLAVCHGRNPNKFVIEGSNNNSSWKALTTASGTWTTANETYITGFELDSPGNYQYVRVTISSVSGTTLQLSEFALTHGSDAPIYHSGSYVGLFGIAKGTVLNDTPAHAEIKNVNIMVDGVLGEDYVGTVVGNAESYVIVDGAYANKQLIAESDAVVIQGNNYVGSLIGSMGIGCEVYGDHVNYAQVNGATFTGGFIGRIFAGAGRQGTGANAGTFYLGEYSYDADGTSVTRRLSMSNHGAVVGTSAYTGGIIGAMIKNVDDYSGVETTFEPTFIRNDANVAGGVVVGGLIGFVEKSVAIRLINTAEEGEANWSYNGSMTAETVVQTSTNYAGGLFGTIGTMGHQITSVFSTATVKSLPSSGTTDGEHIGGLVGYMNGGTFTHCFVTTPANVAINTATNLIQGNKYVGGLAGTAEVGIFEDCYVQGFKYDGNVNGNKGGVIGVAQPVVTVKDTWALYLTADPTYQTIPANTNGKYILSFCSSSEGAMYATIDEMLVFAGLIDDSAITRANATGSANEITAKKGSISLGITLPNAGTAVTDFDTKVQVVFYDGSGYQEAYEGVFESASNDSTGNVLFIRLNSSEDSVIIAKTGVRFGSVTDYTSAVEWEEKYIALSGAYKAEVTDPTDNTGAGTYDGKFVTYYGNYKHTLISENAGSNGETLSNLFDGDVTTKFYKGQSTQTFVVDLGESLYVNGYRWATANDTNSYQTRNPNSFTIRGSNDNSSWTTLLTESGTWTAENFTWVNGGAFTTPGTYRYVEITVKSSGSGMQLSEFRVGNFARTSRLISFSYGKYSEVAPRIIDTLDDWKAFALDVQNSGTGGLRQHVKLANNITVPTKYSDGGTIRSGLAGLESTDNVNAHNFRGTFDGDGYTITIDIIGGNNTTAEGNVASSTNELGLFPQAQDATFQNLTIAGRIESTGWGIGAFVGTARGTLTFYNCTNKAIVKSTGTSSHNVGGIVGTANNQNVTFIGCVNEGEITAEWNYQEGKAGGFIGIGETYYLIIEYGVGGIIGSTGTQGGSTVLIDSCRNKGVVTGDANVGGIVGACRATAQITNCGNSAYIHATNEGQGDTKNSGDCAVGGIVGSASEVGGVNIYACYNSGKIVAAGNKAGGIIGTDAEFETSSKVTEIYNCYNTGDVYTGSETPRTSEGCGVQAGGIAGVAVRVDMNYCYNVGTVTANGYVTHVSNAHGRVGGIIGQAYGNEEKNYSNISNVYNAGQVVIGYNNTTSGSVNRVAYAAGIVGCVESDAAYGEKNVKLTNAFSFEYQVYRPYHYNTSEICARDTADTTTAFRFSGAVLRTKGCALSGTYLSTIDELTCTYDAQTGLVRPKNDSVYRAFGENGKAPNLTDSYHEGTTDADKLKKGLTEGGYVFVYGCLPQLAVFALDTENGTAMTSQNYVKDKMGIYHLEKAGSENNPYVIKDGIDLMGINALSQANYNLDGKYIEFANGENNLAGDVCTEINMPSTDAGDGLDAVNTYHYYQFKHSDSSWKNGKSYHLFSKGAYCSAQTVGDYMSETGATVPFVKNNYARNNWMNANDYWDGSTWKTGANLTTVNIYPIGRYYSIVHKWTDGTGQTEPKSASFKGHIDGSYDGTNPVVISNVRMRLSNVESHSYSGYPTEFINYDDTGAVINNNSTSVNVPVGLFGFVEDATVANIAVTGTIDAWGSGVVSVGVVGKALGNSTIKGVQAGSGDASLTVNTHTGTTAYAGGIVGIADSGASGNRLVFEDCVVDNAVVYSHKNGVGGIVGYTVGDDVTSFLFVTGCEVRKAKLTSGENHFIGGVIGTQGVNGAVTVEDCHVGTKGDVDYTGTTASNASVLIQGNFGLGGIISYADASTTCANAFIDCYVYGDVYIQKTSATNYDASTFYTSIGGITGAITDGNGYATFRDYIAFYGTIDLGGYDGAKNVGGVVGYMGTASRMENCTVLVYGLIDADGCANAENIGGFAGISKGVALDGGFAIAPTMNTDTASNVGGFIGLNAGDTYITRTSLVYTSRVSWVDNDGDEHIDKDEVTTGATGSITAFNKVGGFIGANQEGCELHIGSAEYKGAVYGTDANRAYILLGATVDGRQYVGGFLGYNKGEVYGEYADVINNGDVGTNDASKGSAGATVDCIGGVFGDNSTGALINVSENATFTNNGQVGYGKEGTEDHATAYQEFVGGVLGVALGAIVNEGTLQNTGSVYGYQYVGGAIGGVVEGTIGGTLNNGDPIQAHAVSTSYEGSEALSTADDLSTAEVGNASVTAVVNVGGVIGIVMQNATIDGATMSNYGKVTATGDAYNVSNLGGAIGLTYGVIKDSRFYNYGEIIAMNFAGGSIGVNDGTIQGSEFINYAPITFTGDTALGGAVGYITNNYTSHGSVSYYPDNASLVSLGYVYNDTTRNASIVTDSYFGYESVDNSTKVVLQATGANRYPLSDVLNEVGNASSAFVASGGLGGVFGAINSDDMKADGGWSNNTFFVYGDVYGGTGTGASFVGTVDSVGGVIGAIEVSYVSISNMVIYRSDVGGRNYVGGIVGYNDNANNSEGVGASIDNCYNVYGNVYSTGVASDNDFGGIVGYVAGVSGPGKMASGNKPKTHASYWIMEYANEFLQNSDPNNLTTTLDRAWATFITDAQYENNVDPNKDSTNPYLTSDNGLTWKEYFLKKAGYVVYNNDVGVYEKNDTGVSTFVVYLTAEEYDNGIDGSRVIDGKVKELTHKTVGSNKVANPLAGKLTESGISSWKEYFIKLAGYTINAVGEIGNYGEGGNRYNTGTEDTGYYYLYASDSSEFSAGGITVDHNHETTKLSAPYANNESLNYWLLIVGSAKRAKDADGNYYDSYESDFVHDNVGGAVKKGFIYSTGYAATKNGYYLYVKDQGGVTTLNSTTDADGTVRVFASSDADKAGNVMIFYREVAPRNTLVYNGYERYASLVDLGFDTDYAETLPTSESISAEDKASMVGNYYYTFYDSVSEAEGVDAVNLATSAGTHHLKAKVWSIDSMGNPIVLGTVDSTVTDGEAYKWTIKKRNLEVDFGKGHITDTTNKEDEADAFRFDNTYSHYVKFTVSNIAIDVDENTSDMTNVLSIINGIVNPKYSFGGGTEKAITGMTKGSVTPDVSTIPNPNSDVEFVGFYADSASTSSSGNLNDVQNCYVTKDGTSTYQNVGSVTTYSLTYVIYFKKAGTHKVTVSTTDNNHRSSTSDSDFISVDKRELKLKVNNSGGGSLLPSYTFDGGKAWQGVTSVVISNFVAGTLSDNVDYVTTKGSTDGLSNGNGKMSGNNVVVDTSANTITVYYYANDAGSYTAAMELIDLVKDSYYFVFNGTETGTLSGTIANEPSKWKADWTINKYEITLQNVTITQKENVYYNGQAQTIEFGGADGEADFVKEHGNEVVTVVIAVNVNGASSLTTACNVGEYTVSIGATDSGQGDCTVEGTNSLATKGSANYTINYTVSDGQTMTFKILERHVRLVWDVDNTSFVFTGKAQGIDEASDLKFQMSNDGGDTWYDYDDAKLTLEDGQVKVSNVFEHDGKSETLYFSYSDFTATNAGTYYGKINEFASVSGTNDVGTAQKTNYAASLPSNKSYKINPSQIKVTYSDTTNLDKVFDNTSAITGTLGKLSVSSANGGATNVTPKFTNVIFCDASGNAVVNAGSGYSITGTITLSNTSNYELVSDSTPVYNVGASITARPLTIRLNNASGGNVYKAYDDTVLYATVTSTTDDTINSTGVQMRTGRGMWVSNFVTAGVIVTANFMEVDRDRATFDAYVNNVYKGTDGVYAIGGTNASDTFYKMIRFTLSGEGASNYYISLITDKSGSTLKTSNSTSATYVDLVDGEDVTAYNIEIRKASVKANYSNTSQSYANADNSYNTDWLAVTGQISASKYKSIASVKVTNGWMYDNGTSGEMKVYDKYTRIAGSASSTRLGATLTSTDGKHLCLTLRNQPTLVIGYFVEKDGGYEIGSMAGLLIATEYFKNNFNADGSVGYDYTQTAILAFDAFKEIVSRQSSTYKFAPAGSVDGITSWEEFLSVVPEYDPRGYTIGKETYKPLDIIRYLQEDIEELKAVPNKTEQQIAYIEALKSQIDSIEFVYEVMDAEGNVTDSELTLVWWVPTEASETRSYDSFILVDNVDAILTEADMNLLTGAFGTNWGAGKTYLSNVLYAEVGSVVIFNGPVFDYATTTVDGVTTTTPFNGTFNGDGYTINHLTITQVVNTTDASDVNVGMFAEITGKVTSINLRNLNVQVYDLSSVANTISVGGVAGKYTAPVENAQMVSGQMTDVTVHGTINVVAPLATVYLGGIIGSDTTTAVGGTHNVVDGAIVVATLRAEADTAVVGGIVGIMNNVNAALNGVVSLSEVYAEGTNTFANGFVGKYAKLTDGTATYGNDGISYAPTGNSAYMSNVFEESDGTYNLVEGGVSYTALMTGSTSIFIDGVYPDSSQSDSKPARGTYDVITSEILASNQSKPRESMRLRDIVEVYVLGYELSEKTTGTGESAISTFMKSTTSKYVGTADGTTGNEIKVAYQQHLSLIRMFNYMNFVIAKDVTMYTGYTLTVVDEAFTGTVDAGGHTVNVRNAKATADFDSEDDDATAYPQFFAYQDTNFTWLKDDVQQG